MSSIMIRDLALSKELDNGAMAAVRGGALGPVAHLPFANVNVNVGINQTVAQFQSIQVNTLNNVGVIGADFGFQLDLNPIQSATAAITI
ncbi:hypothetical protein [Aromatoleum diolicum]|uniref:Uncharacterized protein n=1 Tax=Aromatoleum diolicum TaxID=75796 RepID=A0ABX1QIK9_9RHOO|nr:hypothetical protein [Aromatoleum diolicum]NMG77465.1 hypothetical protein [Aromatoleum diolicum]